MLARKSLLKAILICTGIVAIAMVPSAKVFCAQPAPDLAVSVNAVPNPVPYRMGYEVQIIVSNLAPPALINPTMPGPSTLPGTPVPGPGLPPTASPPQGVDVQQADLLLSAAVPLFAAAYGYVSMQTNPPLNVSGCQPAYGVFSNAIRCVIGPLPNGGSWTITLVYRAPDPPACPTAPCVSPTLWFGAVIDDRNAIAERNEANNSASVSVNFQCGLQCTERTILDPISCVCECPGPICGTPGAGGYGCCPGGSCSGDSCCKVNPDGTVTCRTP